MIPQNRYQPTEDELDFARSSIPVEEPDPHSAKINKYAPNDAELDFAKNSMSENLTEEPSYWQSRLQAIPRGIAKGALDLSELGYGLANVFRGGKTASEKQAKREEQELAIEEALPIENEPISKGLERFGKTLPSAALGGEALIPAVVKSAGAAVLGQGAEELGAPKGAQSLLEMLPFLAPDIAKKIIGSSSKQTQLIDFARKQGLSEEQIAHVMHEQDYIRKQVGRVSRSGQSTQDKLKDTKAALSDIYEGLKGSPEASKKIQVPDMVDFFNDYAKAFPNITPSEREKLKPVIDQLLKSEGKGEDFIRFYQHSYKEVSDPKAIGKLQELTRNAVKKIDANLGKDFELANDLFSNFHKTANILRPPINPDFLLYSKAAAGAYGLFSGDYRLLGGVTGLVGARSLANAYLQSPRLQNLGQRFIKSLNTGKVALANKLFDQFRDEVKDISPEFYEETETFDAANFLRSSAKNEQR